MPLMLEFNHRPSPLAYMLRALLPSPGLTGAGGFPPIRAVWRGMRVDQHQLDTFLRLTGLKSHHGLPMLYPQVVGFPLLMAILTCPAFPLPIWNALQIRNHLLQHRPISKGDVLDVESRVATQRILEKGAEVDLHTAVSSQSGLLWESLNTFYYRGRFGDAEPLSPLALAPNIGDSSIARWHTLSGVGWQFGRLTGDYNGIHLRNGYARLFGFPRAFHHPQLVLGQCLAHLPALDPGRPQRLDAWLKGPVFYDCDVALHGTQQADGTAFGLIPEGAARPAMLGLWLSCAPGSRLVGIAGI